MIHNDHSNGSVHIFTDDQISLIENVAKQADTSFALTPTSFSALNMAAVLAGTDIYLIPYDRFVEHRKNWCNSTFADKMRTEYDAAIEEWKKRKRAFEKMVEIISQANQAVGKEKIARIREEIEKEKELIDKIYKPWTSCPHVSSSIVVYETPLGYYVPRTKEVFICLDGIIAKYPSKVESVALLTLFHELGHAIMHNDDHKHYTSTFEYWAEEALANKIALQTISVTRNFVPSLFNHAAAFVQGQPLAYALGYKLYEHNLLDWYALKNNKSNLNKWGAERWLKIVTSEGITSDNIYDVQKAFYVAVSVNDIIYLDGTVDPMRDITIKAFDCWLKPQDYQHHNDNVKNIISKYMGLSYRLIMKWQYDVLADCLSSKEVYDLYTSLSSQESKRRGMPIDSDAIDFNHASFSGITSLIGKYRKFLEVHGL